MKSILISLFFISPSIIYTSFIYQPDPMREVLEMDKKINRLILERNTAEVEKIYSDDFVLITSSGSIKSKQDMVNEIEAPDLNMEINEMIQATVRVHGDAAVLTGVLRQKYTWKGKSYDVKLRVTDTWIKTTKGWQLLSGHAGQYKETN